MGFGISNQLRWYAKELHFFFGCCCVLSQEDRSGTTHGSDNFGMGGCWNVCTANNDFVHLANWCHFWVLEGRQGCLLRYQITRKKLNSVTWQRDGLALHGMQVKEESQLCDGRKEELLADIK